MCVLRKQSEPGVIDFCADVIANGKWRRSWDEYEIFVVALRLLYRISCDQVGRSLIVSSSPAACSTVLEMIVAKGEQASLASKRTSDSDNGMPAPVPSSSPDESTMLIALGVNLATHKEAAEKMCSGSRGTKSLRRLTRKAISEQSTWLFKILYNMSKHMELCASLEP